MNTLKKIIEASVENIYRSYQTIAEPKWSTTLKHSSISIKDGAKAFRDSGGDV
jgi:hypothetical protein